MRRSFVICIGTLLASMLLMSAALADQAGPSVLVHTTQLRRGELPLTVTAYGSVQADPSVRDIVMAPLTASVGAIFVRAGQEVPRGAPLLQLVPNPQTSALYAQAVSALQVASASVRRTQALLDQQLATRQQLADADKVLSDARASLTALRAQGAGGPTTLRAPYRAIVTALSASLHAIVVEGSPLLDLVRPNGLVLLAGLVPDQAAAVARGDKAEVAPVGGGRSCVGRVVLRGSMVDTGSGLVPIQISLPSGALLPGQSAATTITTGTVRGYVVPHAAILVDQDGAPYVVQAVQMVAKLVQIRVLDAAGDQDVIDGPLDPSAPLVLAGNYQLQDGVKVRLAQPADKGVDKAPQ